MHTSRLVSRLLLLPLAAVLGLGCGVKTRATPMTTEQVAPDFALPDQHGKTVALPSLLATGPAVLVFYRGHW